MQERDEPLPGLLYEARVRQTNLRGNQEANIGAMASNTNNNQNGSGTSSSISGREEGEITATTMPPTRPPKPTTRPPTVDEQQGYSRPSSSVQPARASSRGAEGERVATEEGVRTSARMPRADASRVEGEDISDEASSTRGKIATEDISDDSSVRVSTRGGAVREGASSSAPSPVRGQSANEEIKRPVATSIIAAREAAAASVGGRSHHAGSSTAIAPLMMNEQPPSFVMRPPQPIR